MSKIRNIGLEQYGAQPFEQQQFGTANIEGVKTHLIYSLNLFSQYSLVRTLVLHFQSTILFH